MYTSNSKFWLNVSSKPIFIKKIAYLAPPIISYLPMNNIKKYAGIWAPLIITILFIIRTRFPHSFSNAYSVMNEFRVQVDSFLSGHLYIRNHPFFYHHDWSWGIHGINQSWGLGVPMLLTIPELIARIFGKHFPDLLLFPILIFFFSFAFFKLTQNLFKQTSLQIAILVSGLSLFLFSRPFIGLFRSRFYFYEQASVTNILFGFTIWFFLFLAIYKKSIKYILLAAILGGMTVLVRPTGLSWAFTSTISAAGICYYLFRSKLKTLLVMIPGTTGLFLFGLLNTLRFGSPMNVGYPTCFSRATLEISTETIDTFCNRIGSPYFTESIFGAAREFFYFVFFGYDPSKSTPTFRIRWEDIASYDWIYLLLLSVSTLVFLFFIFSRSKNKYLSKEFISGIYLGYFFSLVSFSIFFLFYLRLFMISSRYLLDFYPSVSIFIFISLLTIIQIIVNQKPSLNFAARIFLYAFSCIIILPLFWVRDHSSPSYPGPEHINSSVANENLNWEKSISKYPEMFFPPHQYVCSPEMKSQAKDSYLPYDTQGWNIRYNLLGWNVSEDCRVYNITQAFLKDSECYSIIIDPDQNDDDLKGLKFLIHNKTIAPTKKLVIDSGSYKNYTQISYCTDFPSPTKDLNWTLASVAVTPVESLGKYPTNKMIRLLKIWSHPKSEVDNGS